MIEAGTTLQQRYRIDKQIGQGGMGAVYVATDERFGSKVAIKETLCMDDNFRKAIEREARLLNNLKHSALPRVSDHFEESNGQFLVMEYIPGDDLGSILIPGENKFTVEQILKWADQLLDALDYLHNQENPVIHRDIKPQNLKINSRGDIILLDFGLAKGNPSDVSHQTAAKSIFGYSRNYASLEQIQGTGTDPRSDLYSLAATLYHLLTNVSPEDALTRAMAVLSQKTDPLVPASTLNPAVPRGVAGVLQKALSLNADERPGSAAEMRQMLHESENYGYLVDDVTIAGKVGNTIAFGQETKLMPDNTRADFNKQIDIKTEILPANISEETSVRTGGSAARATVAAANLTAIPPQKSRFGAAVVALGLLLVGGLIAGGLVVAKPSLFGIGSKEADKTADAGTTVPPIANAVASSNANSNTSAAVLTPGLSNSNTNNAPAKVETTRPTDTVTKPVDTTKNNKTPTTAGVTPDELDIPDIQVSHGDKPGDIVITERRPDGSTTTNVIKNPNPPPNGRRQPPMDPMNPFPPGFDMRGLTPEQQRRIKAAIRNGKIKPPNPNRPPPN